MNISTDQADRVSLGISSTGLCCTIIIQERETWIKKIQVLDKELREKIAEKEEELQEFKESIHQIKPDSSSSQWSSSDEGDFHAHEEIVNTASQEISDSKRTRDRLKDVAGTIFHGLASGAAGAITTSVVGALAEKMRLEHSKNTCLED
ncbi:hypothetical protein BJX68DRAFT_268682 [Aspergillus pseudodeflectus]|uniref:Uncharacterized protein n=1 Tax=Aspergillus pseudodeflectus TaxID=176178 RepID=A0ABR4K2S1_9EURO